ncbi:MAG: hypothetical protein K8F91_02670 [Candidatus Obscuribacterales bacterium]|nr:hypothetical protein [Candidatus Obscuribacterales bacterium]
MFYPVESLYTRNRRRPFSATEAAKTMGKEIKKKKEVKKKPTKTDKEKKAAKQEKKERNK